MNTRKIIGSRIKELRKKAKMTQEQVAELSQITAKHLGSIECGNENPTIETLLKISEALNTEILEVLDYRKELGRKEMQKNIIKAIKTADDRKLRLILRFISILKE